MKKPATLFIGLDVHKDSISVAHVTDEIAHAILVEVLRHFELLEFVARVDVRLERARNAWRGGRERSSWLWVGSRERVLPIPADEALALQCESSGPPRRTQTYYLVGTYGFYRC